MADSPKRADALRNRETLLRVAREAFATVGPDVALDDIARRAGLGNATLYRHFPTRHDLVVALCRDAVDELCALGTELAATHRPRQALEEWLQALVDHFVDNAGLAAALSAEREGATIAAQGRAAVHDTGLRLFDTARSAGAIRDGVDFDDLFALAGAATSAAGGDRASARRMLGVILNGITLPSTRRRPGSTTSHR